MTKGTKIEITETAKYNGQDMRWTETFTGTEIIGEGGEWVTHRSNRPLKEFRAKETCVTPYAHSEHIFNANDNVKQNNELEKVISNDNVKIDKNWRKYIYAIFLPEGTEVDTYSSDEYRLHLSNDIHVEYIGYEQDVYIKTNDVRRLRYTLPPKDFNRTTKIN